MVLPTEKQTPKDQMSTGKSIYYLIAAHNNRFGRNDVLWKTGMSFQDLLQKLQDVNPPPQKKGKKLIMPPTIPYDVVKLST